MDDKDILNLYFARDEQALGKTADKYGTYCMSIAYGILGDKSDSEECVNDTYLRAWNSIPPNRPESLRTYLGKLTRNLAYDVFRKHSATRRVDSELVNSLEELSTCISSCDTVESRIDSMVLGEALNRFLEGEGENERRVFVRRYWYNGSVGEIAESYGMSEGKVKMMLYRMRKKLRSFLEREGIKYE